MIATGNLTINGRAFVRTYSDGGYRIERDGAVYDEAVDPAEFGRTYTETDELIETGEMDETGEKAQAYDILTGVNE